MSAAAAASSMPRSTSTQQMHTAASSSGTPTGAGLKSPTTGLANASNGVTGRQLHHYESAAPGSSAHPHGGVTPSSSSPHLSHLRQQSSMIDNAHGHSHGISGHGGEHHHHQPHFPTSAAGYDVYEEIGVGAFATVYHASVHGTGEQVAIKVIDLDQFNTNWEEIRREILIMSLVHHPNVVRILTSFVEEQDLWIVMPWLEAGSCAHVMKTMAPTGLKDDALIATILKEVLLGLQYFHNDGRLHRDLKAGNIIISKSGEVMLADFGVAGTLMENGDRKKARKTFTGTPCWMAPEVMEHSDRGYDEKADIWSFGITALELAYGRAPYARFPPMKVMVLTLQEDPPTGELYKDHSYEFSRHFHSMVEKCLRKDPEKRPSVKKLLEHKFFKYAKDKNYVVDKIVRKMPNLKCAPPANAKLLNLCALRHPTLHNGGGMDLGGLDAEKGRPVSVGSWVFDKDEFEELKARVKEEKERDGVAAASRCKSLQQSYGEDDTPKGAGASAAAAGGGGGVKFTNRLGVPGAHGQDPRSPASSASDDASGHSSEGEREMPSFDDPTGKGSAAQRLQSITITPAAGGSGPGSAHGSPAGAATPRMSPSPLPQSPAGSPAAGAVASPQHVLSPGSEHQEGRFHVREDDDGDDGDDGGEQGDEEHQYEQQQQNGQYESEMHFTQSASNSQQQSEQGSMRQMQPHVSGSLSGGGDVDQPAFHNEGYCEDDDDDGNAAAAGGQAQQPHVEGEDAHTQHVGRFTCVDDDDDGDDDGGDEQ